MSMRARIVAVSALLAVAIVAAVWFAFRPERTGEVVVGGMGNGCQCTKRLER